MTAPSSPVPAVEAVAYMADCGNTAIAQGDVRFWRASRREEAETVASMYGTTAVPLYRTPTPGRAAEPDTMGEVEGEGSLYTASAMRRVVAEMNEFRTRTETAEAQLATLRAEKPPVGIPAKLRPVLETIWRYGEIYDVKGVVYPTGSHRECLNKLAAHLWPEHYAALSTSGADR